MPSAACGTALVKFGERGNTVWNASFVAMAGALGLALATLIGRLGVGRSGEMRVRGCGVVFATNGGVAPSDGAGCEVACGAPVGLVATMGAARGCWMLFDWKEYAGGWGICLGQAWTTAPVNPARASAA